MSIYICLRNGCTHSYHCVVNYSFENNFLFIKVEGEKIMFFHTDLINYFYLTN